MTSDLERFRAHAHAMAQPGAHRSDCHARTVWNRRPVHPNPSCSGCVTDDDRALWARLASETADHLTRRPETA